ncbi:MAG: hypothetical protein HYS62_02235 [Candidatus Aenigmarchaeota archaeon]|nr:hypothetical protein [Candidatus Aenigmarchaeota archaeon]
MRKLVVCEINETYLKNVKEQMKKQRMPIPEDDNQITIAHKPIAVIDSRDLCDCKICKELLE